MQKGKSMEEKRTRSFSKHLITLGAGTIVYMIVGFIGTPIITRIVEPNDYGQMSMLSVYSSLLMMLCGLGLDQTLVRFFYHSDDVVYKQKLLNVCYRYSLTAFGAMVVLLCGYCAVAAYVKLPHMSPHELLLLLLNVLVLLFSRYVMLSLRLMYKTKAYSVINIIQKLTYVIVTIVLVCIFKGHHFICLAVATIVSTLIAIGIGVLNNNLLWMIYRVKDYQLPFSRKKLVTYGLPLMLASGITVLFNSLDRLALNKFCTAYDVGVYASAMNIMAVFSVIKTSFSALWMPAAIENYERNPEDTSFYQKGNAIIAMGMLIFGACVILFKDLIVLLLGNKYYGAAQIIPFLMFEPIMYTISESTATGIAISKKSKYQLLVSICACLANFIGNIILTPWLGGQGAAASTAIAYILFCVLRTWLSNKGFYVNYHMKRFLLVTVMLFSFAYYSANNVFSLLYICFFILFVLMTLLAYREYVPEALFQIRNVIERIVGNKNKGKSYG